MNPNIEAIQSDLRAAKLDGWLFYDFRGRDPIALRILNLPDGMRTRRWFYFIPAKGKPRKLVHRIESEALAALPGETSYFSAQEELHGNLKKVLGRAKLVAMQYSPKNNVPYVSMVDAGTIELVKGTGVRIATSGDLVQKYEACWSEQQRASHLTAGRAIDAIVQGAFAHAAQAVKAKHAITEYELQQWIVQKFEEAGLTTENGPDAAVNQNASDPHYGATKERAATIKQGDLLLLDVWGKQKTPNSVYYDITWVGYLGPKVPEKIAKVFGVVRDARETAVELIQRSVAAGKPLQGWQVDRAARRVVEKAGYGKYFFHRTGHNIGQAVHGNGANMDGLETHDARHLIPRTCTSIEPGIYLPDFGIRSEVDVYIDEKEARVTGVQQHEVLALLS